METQKLDLKAEIKLKETVQRAEYMHVFSNVELLSLGASLATKNRELEQLELDKKSSASHFKSRIEAKQAEAKIAACQLQDRSEWRSVDAKKIPDFERMEWDFFHPETGELLRSDRISLDEIKNAFPFYKDFEAKKMVWYNPKTETRLTYRNLEPSETQLKIEEVEK